MKIWNYIKNHKIKTLLIGIVLSCIIGMTITGTLSYPYIMIDRQIEMWRYCSGKGTRVINTKDFGFHIEVPSDYCLLPHRIFPEDGSIQAVPNGNYSVINEYAKGTIIDATRTTILFERTEAGRSPAELIEKMGQGGFLKEATVTEFTNKNNLKILLVKNSTGLDNEGQHFNWAFILHPNGKILISLLSAHPEDPTVFNYIMDNIAALD